MRDAERAARNAPGVTEVENKLTVTRGFTLTSDTRNGGLGVTPSPRSQEGNIMNARLQQLEQKYTALDAQMPSRREKQASLASARHGT